jgi:hypothetical protein
MSLLLLPVEQPNHSVHHYSAPTPKRNYGILPVDQLQRHVARLYLLQFHLRMKQRHSRNAFQVIREYTAS